MASISLTADGYRLKGDTMRVTYLGQSGFLLEADGKAVLLDPWLTGSPVATMRADDVPADVIALSHAHDDHGIVDAIAISKRTGAPVIATAEVGYFMGEQGANAMPANHGGTVRFEGGSIKLTPAWHTSSYYGQETFVAGDMLPVVGVPAGLIVRFGGLTAYHTGDTALFRDMELIGDEGIDVMFVCIGDRFTMGPDDAVRAVRFVRPRFVVPMHYNTFPPIEQDAEAFKTQVETAIPGVRCTVMAPGDVEEFTTSGER